MTGKEIIKAYYQAFNQRDWNGMFQLLDEQIEHQPNQGKPRIGKELFREFMQKMDNSYAETLADIVIFEGEKEGRFAAEFIVHGTYKVGEPGLPIANGQKYILPAAAFLEVKNDRITRVTTYYNLEDWIEQVSK